MAGERALAVHLQLQAGVALDMFSAIHYLDSVTERGPKTGLVVPLRWGKPVSANVGQNISEEVSVASTSYHCHHNCLSASDDLI